MPLKFSEHLKFSKQALIVALVLPFVMQTEGMPLQAQTGTQSVVVASAQKELPLKAWGPFQRLHLGPCCMVDQVLGQQFVFPLVISQERQAILPVRTLGADGKTTLKLAPVWLQRRAMGMAPVQAMADDRAATGPTAGQNRRAQILDVNPEGLLWAYRVPFAPAGINQANATLKSEPDSAQANPANPQTGADANQSGAWGAGEAVVECFPAFAEPDGDGLLLRISLTNRGQTGQTYCVDLLAGMDTPGPAFTLENFLVNASPDQSGVSIQHGKSRASFALASVGPPYRSRFYRVNDAFFSPLGAVALRDSGGGAIPGGLMPSIIKSETEPQYALNRVENVAVAPGQTVTLFLSIGVGKDQEGARSAAQTLLAATTNPELVAKGDKGDLYLGALKAHRASRFHTGDGSKSGTGLEALDRLMAQSFANAPNVDGRRIGVGTRQTLPGDTGTLYEPARDALMAVGWTAYRPNFAASQLNAWFQTKNNPDDISGVPIRNPRAVVPTNLMALWEVYLRTHDRALLTRYYPFARRRYQELLVAGRAANIISSTNNANSVIDPNDKSADWLFVWPSTVHDTVFLPETTPGALVAAPDYAAYVIRSARLMQAISQITNAPLEERRQYVLDVVSTSNALNTQLWDAKQSRYLLRPLPGAAVTPAPTGAAANAPPVDTLTGLLPLMAGIDSITPEQRAAMMKALTDPAAFWSGSGLRTISKASPRYRADDATSGAVRFGLNWLFWKGLLDLGDLDTAHKLAQNLLKAYDLAATGTGTCPEWLNGDTGIAGGRADYVGDAGVLPAMWAAYHQKGYVSTGWNLNLLETTYLADKDSLHLVARRLEINGVSVLLCVMGHPNGKYRLSGVLSGSQTADADGVLSLTLPKDDSTLVLDINPE